MTEVELRDGSTGFATDGTPVDCVRFGDLGLVGERPDLIVSGINYGYNLGDDVTYSGTVAAAFEGIAAGHPRHRHLAGRAHRLGLGLPPPRGLRLRPRRRVPGPAGGQVVDHGMPDGTVLNVNVPAQPPGSRVGRLGKRIYRDRLELESDREGRRRYRIYGDDPSYHDEPGTDFRAIAEGRIAITPIHLDLTSHPGLEVIERWSLPAERWSLTGWRPPTCTGAQRGSSSPTALKATSLGTPPRHSNTASRQLSIHSRR